LVDPPTTLFPRRPGKKRWEEPWAQIRAKGDFWGGLLGTSHPREGVMVKGMTEQSCIRNNPGIQKLQGGKPKNNWGVNPNRKKEGKGHSGTSCADRRKSLKSRKHGSKENP